MLPGLSGNCHRSTCRSRVGLGAQQSQWPREDREAMSWNLLFQSWFTRFVDPPDGHCKTNTVDEAIVDAHGEEEQKFGLLTMMQEHLVLPFAVSLLGVEATVEKVTMTCDGRIVAVCQRDGVQQRIDILDLPLPKPAPAGAE
jgi:hypothetical protein